MIVSGSEEWQECCRRAAEIWTGASREAPVAKVLQGWTRDQAEHYGDCEESITAVALYFFSSANGGLAGGTDAEWRSDTENLTFTIFGGTTLAFVD